jgi:hypothetical protein
MVKKRSSTMNNVYVMGGNYTEIHHNNVVVLSVHNGDVNIETMNDLVMEGGKKVVNNRQVSEVKDKEYGD